LHEVYTRVYIGGDADYEKVKDKEGWSFLRVYKYGPGGHRQTLGYTTRAAPKGPNYLWVTKGDNLMALNILDLDDPNMIPFEAIKHGLDFAKSRLDAGDKLLIACNQGHSRGPTTGLMFLRSLGDLPYHFVKAESIYKTLDPMYDPGMGMRQIARSHWAELDKMELPNATNPG
jgi:hypothetical protein